MAQPLSPTINCNYLLILSSTGDYVMFVNGLLLHFQMFLINAGNIGGNNDIFVDFNVRKIIV